MSLSGVLCDQLVGPCDETVDLGTWRPTLNLSFVPHSEGSDHTGVHGLD